MDNFEIGISQETTIPLKFGTTFGHAQAVAVEAQLRFAEEQRQARQLAGEESNLVEYDYSY